MSSFDDCFRPVEPCAVMHGRQPASRLVSMTMCAIAVLALGFAVTAAVTAALFVLLVLS